MPFAFDLVSLIELFDVSPEVGELESYTFTVQRDGLTLELTAFPEFGDVYFTIRRDTVEFPIIDCQYEGCRYLKSIIFPNGSRAAQIGLAENDISRGADHQNAVQIFTSPNLGVRYIVK